MPLYPPPGIAGKPVDDAGLADKRVLRYDEATETFEIVSLAALQAEVPTIANIYPMFIGKSVRGSASWAFVTQFAFGGSADWGSPDQILAISSQSKGGSRTHGVRIYDVTNGNVIASATGFTHQVLTLIDLGAVSNVPTDPAIWEVQVQKTGSGSMNISVENITMRYV